MVSVTGLSSPGVIAFVPIRTFRNLLPLCHVDHRIARLAMEVSRFLRCLTRMCGHIVDPQSKLVSKLREESPFSVRMGSLSPVVSAALVQYFASATPISSSISGAVVALAEESCLPRSSGPAIPWIISTDSPRPPDICDSTG